YDGELPVIALEVERLIFEDLVNEVVLGEASHGSESADAEDLSHEDHVTRVRVKVWWMGWVKISTEMTTSMFSSDFIK
nr:protein longifolia 1-like [Tanacetum cinerariifolium]